MYSSIPSSHETTHHPPGGLRSKQSVPELHFQQTTVNMSHFYSMEGYPSPAAYSVQSAAWYNNYFSQPYRVPGETLPSHPSPYPTSPVIAHCQQPTISDSFQHRNSRNELRAAIFEKVLSSFPKLQKLLHESGKPENSNDRPSCLFQNQPSPPLPTPAKTFLFPSMANHVMEDEMDPGYFSFTDGMSPKIASTQSPTGCVPRYSPVMDLPPHITQLLDQVMDNTPDLVDMMVDNESPLDTRAQVPHAIQVPQPTPVQGKVSPQQQPNDITIKPASKKFVCEICNKEYATKANLRVHQRRHSGHRPYKCTWCLKTFNQKSTLRTHIRIHTGERPYQCKHCDKSFADYSTFTKHNRTHTGEKPYFCSICGKTFAQSGNMIRHQQTHKDLVPSLKQLSPMIN